MTFLGRAKLFFIPAFLFSIFLSTDSKSISDQKLAETFAPKIYFHPTEKYFPSSIEWYLQRSQLVTVKKKAKKVGVGPLKVQRKKAQLKIEKPKPLTPGDLAGKPKEFFVDPMGKKETYKGTMSGNQSKAPIYVSVFRKPGSPNTAAIMYWTFYPYNGPFQGLSVAGKDLVGYHEADWEVLILYVKEDSPENWSITRLYFGRHGRDFGEPMDPTDKAMEWEGKHPIALSARFGHGLYPASVSAKWTRKAADAVSKGSKYWDTWNKVILITQGTGWNTFKGHWGYAGGGPTGPAMKLLWRRTQAGEGAPKLPRYTQLREYKVGTGKERKKKRKMFKMSLSSHYSDICFSLVNANGQLVTGTDYKIMERKRLKKKNKEWYSIKGGKKCVKSRVVEHKEMKGTFVKITKRGPKANGPLKLIIEGLEPF